MHLSDILPFVVYSKKYHCLETMGVEQLHVWETTIQPWCFVQKCNWLCCNVGCHVFEKQTA